MTNCVTDIEMDGRVRADGPAGHAGTDFGVGETGTDVDRNGFIGIDVSGLSGTATYAELCFTIDRVTGNVSAMSPFYIDIVDFGPTIDSLD